MPNPQPLPTSFIRDDGVAHVAQDFITSDGKRLSNLGSVPTVHGAPVAVPTFYDGHTPMAYDLDSDTLYVYNDGWKSIAFA